MGFKDVEWAYALTGLALREKVVLVAVCHRTLDKTHETFVSQQTIASMLSSSLEYVSRSLRVLESLGIIARSRRTGAGGYRTSDLIVVNTTYTHNSLQGQEPSRPTAHKDDSRHLPDSQSPPTGTTAGAEENTQKNNQKNNQITPIPPDRFDEFWTLWPRKVGKPQAKKAFDKAIKRAEASAIIDAAIAYAANPHLPEKAFIPHASTWLNRDGWDDELPTARSNSRPTPTQRAVEIARAGQNLIDSRRGLTPVTTLTPKAISS